MNGTVVSLLVEPGSEVRAGTPLMIMEAMKMEHTIRAPGDGTVSQFYFARATSSMAARHCWPSPHSRTPAHDPAPPLSPWSRWAPGTGLQNESARISLATKLQLIDDLAAAGLTVIEAGSFVNPKWIPQMADSAEVFQGWQRRPGRSLHRAHAQPAGPGTGAGRRRR